MTTFRRRLVIAAVAFVAISLLAWTAVVATVYAAGGVATVSIQEKGMRRTMTIPIPMLVVHGASGAVRASGFRAPISDALEGEGAPVPAEVFRAADRILRAIDQEGSFTLVEVRDQGSDVTVRSHRGKLLVDVHDGGDAVNVSIPIGSARRLIRDFAAITDV